jgi:hypothetical protein
MFAPSQTKGIFFSVDTILSVAAKDSPFSGSLVFVLQEEMTRIRATIVSRRFIDMLFGLKL